MTVNIYGSRKEALEHLTGTGQPYELVNIRSMGRQFRVFKNAPGSLRELYTQSRSGKDFIVYGDERLSFEDVFRQSCILAAELVQAYGVVRGDRVAIAMRNYPEWIISFNAITMVGGVAVVMNAMWQSDEMIFALNDVAPKLLIADKERITRLATFTDIQFDMAVIVVRDEGDACPKARKFSEIICKEMIAEPPLVDLDPDDDATIIYTSGSTGHPKGAVSTHRNILNALFSWELDAQISIQTGLVKGPTFERGQAAALLAIPLFHVTGLHAGALSSYRSQRRLVCMFKWDALTAAEIIESEQITFLCAPSTVTGDLIDIARRQRLDLGSLEFVGGGGASRAPNQVRAIGQVFRNAKPFTGWGMTETNAIGTAITAADYQQHPLSSGQVSAILDIRVAGDIGQINPPLHRGELHVRGSSVVRGYWNRPAANQRQFEDGWFKTGDLAYIDQEGFLHIVGRIKDVVIRGGENIGCGLIEAAIQEYPHVLEVGVYGVPDYRLGEELAATIRAEKTIIEDELRAFLHTRLARFEIPRYLQFQRSPLPRIAAGKIDKRRLRNEIARNIQNSETLD